MYHCAVGKVEKHKLYKMSKVRRSPKDADEGQHRWLQTTRSTKLVEVDITTQQAFAGVTLADHLGTS